MSNLIITMLLIATSVLVGWLEGRREGRRSTSPSTIDPSNLYNHTNKTLRTGIDPSS